MKRLLLTGIILTSVAVTVQAQTLAAIDTGKYRIEMPGYWRPGNKIWKILTEKLPLISPELEGKELCGDDCNPRYRIELELSDPLILDHIPNHVASDYKNVQNYRQTDTWDIRTLYSFESSLLLRNDSGMILTRFIIVDTNEVWSVSNRVNLAAYTPAIINTMPNSFLRRALNRNANNADLAALYYQQVGSGSLPQTGQEGETPFAYINKNREKLVPAQRDMLAIIDSKINSW